MDFAIHPDLIGSKKYRLSDGSWIDNPENMWIAGNPNSERDLLVALFLAGKKIEITPPNPYLKVIQKFTFRKDLPWQMIMPDHAYEKWVEKVSDKIYKAFKRADLSYYENIFKRSCEVFEALEPMRIHRKKWRFLDEHDIQGVSSKIIDSFMPNEDGFADPIKFSLISTISGRSKVVSGPEILRLNKELKSIIKSRYKKGNVIQFDYVSLEPRLALILAGHEVSKDIYSDINRKLFNNKFSRDIVKVATLSVMYGAGAKNLSERTDLPVKTCKEIIKEMKEFFGIHKMAKKLSKEYRSKKIIRNHFGRAIYPESGAGHKLYNNFIQSSAVDAAMLGFWNIIELWKDSGIVPIFTIHDNIGLDFPKDMANDENIEKTKEAGSKIPNLPGKLLLDHDKI